MAELSLLCPVPQCCSGAACLPLGGRVSSASFLAALLSRLCHCCLPVRVTPLVNTGPEIRLQVAWPIEAALGNEARRRWGC